MSDEERIKEIIRYKTEQLKLLAIGSITIIGGCLSLALGANDVFELILTYTGFLLGAMAVHQGIMKHLQIKKLLNHDKNRNL